MMPQDAKSNMFCPFKSIVDNSAISSTSSSYKNAHCKGDVCMMWRWFDPQKSGGYCGLAGRDGTH